jgi:hypothetical protein
MKKRLFLFLVALLLWISTSVSGVFAASYFDTKDIDNGVVHISYDGGGKTKIMVQKDDKKYIYDINSAGKPESYPLQLGNGTYKISLLVNTSGSSYRLISSQKIDLKLKDPNSVFLTSIQNINWNVDSKAVAKAVELTKDITDPSKKAQVLWKYMVNNNAYDYEKLSTLTSGYVPVIDKTLEEKKGICYDFSSLYAAMLRSQGYPSKLIKGYAPKNASGYHAWNEVYSKTRGEWIVVDTTYDLQVVKRNPKVYMIKKSADYDMVYEY